MILQTEKGFVNIFIEPKLQTPGGAIICTVQIEKYEDVVALGHRLSGDIQFNRYAWFPFTGYSTIDQLVHFFEAADWKSLRLHQGDFSEDPVAFFFEGWYEEDHDEDQTEEIPYSDTYIGYVLPEDREDFRFSFEKNLDYVAFYPVFSMPKEFAESIG